MIEKSPSKPRINVEPEIIGAGKFVRGAPCSRSSFVRTGRKIRRNALKSLVWRKETTLGHAFFVSLEPVFSRQKSALLAHKRALCRWPHYEERRQQGISKASSDKGLRGRLLAASEAFFDAVSRQNEVVETE
jgi:hypothetical protein